MPYQGAAARRGALLGGHIGGREPREVAVHVQGGKLKMLAVMADHQRLKRFDKVLTLKERNIDLSIGTWRGLAVHKATSPEVAGVLRTMARKGAEEPMFREQLDKLNLGFSYLDAFGKAMQRDHEYFKQLVQKLGIKV